METVPYEPHVGETRQYVRDIILGVNDGLVSTFLLVAGVVGGGLSVEQVMLAAVAGAVAGAVSMAAGEYLATKSQDEVFESEIELEKVHLKHHRQSEVAQLEEMLAKIGIEPEDLPAVVAAFNRSDRTMLNAMKVLEFGIVESERRSPYRAAVAAGLLFFLGSTASFTPFIFATSTGTGLLWAGIFTAIGLFAVGVLKTTLTRTSPIRSGFENLVVAGFGGAAAYLIGRVVGANLS